MIYLKTEKYDLKELYDAIAKYYPIGFPTTDPAYKKHQGIIEMTKLITNAIHDEKNYQNEWLKIESEVQEEIQMKITGTTYGQSPSYSAYVELEKVATGNLIRYKEIYFFVSLLGKYYTIVGQDRNEIRIGSKLFSNTNYIVISPENEFGDLFEKLSRQIVQKFEGYKFVPYIIYNQLIHGLYSRYQADDKSKIFEAIFNNQIDLSSSILGSADYQLETWINRSFDLNNEPQWTIHPPDS